MNSVAAAATGLRPFGFVEWFRPGEHARVRAAIDGMRRVGATSLRTHLSWADHQAPGGQDWYDWLIPTLGQAFDLLPCIHYTPPSLSRTGLCSGAPRRLRDYADFVDGVLRRYGENFRHVELWNEPNNLLDWDWREDHDWLLFCEMIGDAAHWVEQRGFKAVLGGPCPFDPNWLELMGERGILGTVSAVGFHGFPGTWDSEASTWRGFDAHLQAMRTILDRYKPGLQIWLTETGYSTWRNDEAEQVERFRDALAAPAERLYWYGWQDIPRDVAVQEGLYFDPRHYHLGVNDAQGRPKLLRRLLEAGIVTPTPPTISLAASTLAAPVLLVPRDHVAIIGGAGFIGSNLADALLRDGEQVVVLDSLARPGVEQNLAWLQDRHGLAVRPLLADLRDTAAVADAVVGAKAVYHLAAQVAVTSSLLDPRHDFSVNAEGTLNVLEVLRERSPSTPLVFASTNKVYGQLADLEMAEVGQHHLPCDPVLRGYGIDERRALDFCTPYGCSKGVADQYVLDYAHSFGLRTAVLRMSCIYGPRQFGTEDQGWVAHFLIRALGERADHPLWRRQAGARHPACRGCGVGLSQADGPRSTTFVAAPSISAAARRMRSAWSRCSTRSPPSRGDAAPTHREAWRTGDQPWFVADTRRLAEATGWRPEVGWRDGLRDLAGWLQGEPAGRTASRVVA